MLRVSDLVRDSKLDTEFHPEHTKHIYYESGLTPRERTVRREECWKWKRHIGRGGYGTVWLEHCVVGHGEVELRAVKMISKPQRTQKSINYDRELETIAKFSHRRYERCFVKSFGWYENADAVFIAMEYLQHGDLEDHLSVTSPLPEAEAKQITYQILEGLFFMHDNGFAHRDLKPRNILVKSKPPEQWWVKISDFGISKRAEEGLMVSTLKGTWGFLAPELLGLIKNNDDSRPWNTQAADMWSLGEIVFRMLTGEPTFKDMGILIAYIQKPEDFLSKPLLDHGVSSEGCELLQRVMIPTPEERLTANDALLHDWMEPQRSLSLKPSSTVFQSSPFPQNPSIPIGADLISEPSARWSTIEMQSRTLPQPIQDGTRANIAYTLPNRTVNKLNETNQRNRDQKPQEAVEITPANHAAENAKAKLEDKSYMPGDQKYSDMLRKAEDLATVYRNQDQYNETEPYSTEAARYTLRGHSGAVWAVAFSPEGKLVASGSSDKTVRLWDSMTGKARHTLMGHSRAILSVAFSPNGKLVASGSGDKTFKLWDSLTGALRFTLQNPSTIVGVVGFSSNGMLMTSGYRDKTVRLWNSTTELTAEVGRYKLESPSDKTKVIAFSADSKLVASESGDNVLRLWDLPSGAARHTLQGHPGIIVTAAFSLNSKQVASGSWDQTVRVWDLATGVTRYIFNGHSDSVTAVAFSPDGKLVASASEDKTVRLWSLASEGTE